MSWMFINLFDKLAFSQELKESKDEIIEIIVKMYNNSSLYLNIGPKRQSNACNTNVPPLM